MRVVAIVGAVSPWPVQRRPHIAATSTTAAGRVATLRIGCAPDIPLQRLQGFLGALYAEDPRLVADVSRMRSDGQLGGVLAGELDLGLIHSAAAQPGIETETLFPGEPLCAYLPVGHRLAARPALRPQDLRDETLVVFPRSADPALAERLAELLAAAGYRFRHTRETHSADDRDVAFTAVERHGVMVAPASVARILGDTATLMTAHPLDPPVRMPDTALAWRADGPRGPAGAIARARDLARSFRRS